MSHKFPLEPKSKRYHLFILTVAIHKNFKIRLIKMLWNSIEINVPYRRKNKIQLKHKSKYRLLICSFKYCSIERVEERVSVSAEFV